MTEGQHHFEQSENIILHLCGHKTMLQQVANDVMLRDEVWEGTHCEFFQFSKGVRIVYNKEVHHLKEFSLCGESIDDERIYKIGLQYYFYLNMKDFFSVSHEEVEKNEKPRKVATSCREVLDECLSCHQNLDHQLSGRLVIE